MTKDSIHFPLDKIPAETHLVYRPWGTRSLKVSVSTNRTTPSLRLRPKGMRAEEVKEGIFRAYTDDDDVFIISWGGGHESGPCVQARDFLKVFEECAPLEPNRTSIVFFNLTHIGPGVPDTATVTLQAYNEDNGELFASLPVRLQKPTPFPANVMRFSHIGESGLWQVDGEMLPRYDPRWWPHQVAYVPAGPLPLTIQRYNNTLQVQWETRPIAIISDHTRPSILNENSPLFELFDFDQWHVALRIWFFWLDVNVGSRFFVGRHEVPDAERFDLLIRKRDGRVTLACTDLHWREVWGEVDGEPLRATLGLSRAAKIKLVEESFDKLWSILQHKQGKDHDRIYNPMESYIPRKAAVLGQETVYIRGKGLEAHLPALENVLQGDELPPRMTSSDVRLG